MRTERTLPIAARFSLFLLLAILLSGNPSNAQQLISNGDFESYNQCPQGFSAIDSFPKFPTVQSWVRPTETSSDYYNVCGSNSASVPFTGFGYQQPHSGSAYAGFFAEAQYAGNPHYREYLSSRLMSPMKKDALYCVRFYLNLGYQNNPNFDVAAVLDVGACFTDTLPGSQSMNGPLLLPYHVVNSRLQYMTDTGTWYEVRGQYRAKGGEEWITIGTFGANPPEYVTVFGAGKRPIVSYFFVDDVSVTPTVDTVYKLTLCSKPKTLSSGFAKGPYRWSTGDTSRSIVVTTPGVYHCEVGAECPTAFEHFDVAMAPIVDTTIPTPVCPTGPVNVQLTAPQTSGPYEWSTGDTSRSIRVDRLGDYYCDVLKNCSTQRTRYHLQFETVSAPLINDTVICQHVLYPQLAVYDSNLIWYADPADSTGTPKQPTINTSTEGKQVIYVVRSERGCQSLRHPVSITIRAAPEKQLESVLALRCAGDAATISFGNDDCVDCQYFWRSGDTVCCIQVVDEGTYVRIRDNGCGTAEDYFQFRTERCENCVAFPNSFSPNNDGRNDRFKALPRCSLLEFQMQIYNRWGEMVYSSNQLSDGWDGTLKGKKVEAGVYMYYATFKSSQSGMKYVVKGDVTIFR